MNQKCITRLTAQTMHFMLHNTDWVYSSISTDDCRGFWNSCTLYLPVQHTDTYTNIHPVCSPFLHFRQLYKSPLELDSADCSVAWGEWVYSSISTDDCRGFWNSCTLYLHVQHTGTYANIHPVCSPFLRFRQLYKSPLGLDSADCSIAWGYVYLSHAADSIAFCGVWSGSLREGGS